MAGTDDMGHALCKGLEEAKWSGNNTAENIRQRTCSQGRTRMRGCGNVLTQTGPVDELNLWLSSFTLDLFSPLFIYSLCAGHSVLCSRYGNSSPYCSNNTWSLKSASVGAS
jgi:hypothetical protein